MVDLLARRDGLRFHLVVLPRVQVAGESREGGRSHPDTKPTSWANRNTGLPEIEMVGVDRVGSEKLGL
jgi:hypothetical protein